MVRGHEVEGSNPFILTMFYWTKELPTVSGFYWWRKYPSWAGKIVDVYQSGLNETMMMDGWSVALQAGEWAGPIPKPIDAVGLGPSQPHKLARTGATPVTAT